MLRGKKIVVGITGSIAAYKIPFLIRMLVKEEAEVKVIMTPASTAFVTPLTLSTLTKNPVTIDPFQQTTGEWNNHVELGLWADIMLFAPVTANTLAKMAHGQADNFLITAYLSARCPIFIAPAMDMDMYNHPATLENINILEKRGHRIIEPQTGELASGLSGPGRLEEPSKIVEEIINHFQTNKEDLKGKKILITAGPTYEKIDPVRFIGNFSSGKMGFALAQEASRRGGDVTLITGPTHLNTPVLVRTRVDVVSAEEMFEACIENHTSFDLIIMSAAVADYTPQNPADQKLKKKSTELSIHLQPTKDILHYLGTHKRVGQKIVGFALETEHGLEYARKKLEAKNIDMVVLNSANTKGAGFNVDTNVVTLLIPGCEPIHGSLKCKEDVANDILDVVVNQLVHRETI